MSPFSAGIRRFRPVLLTLGLMLLTGLSCNLPRTLFETFASPNDLDPQAVATWEEHYEGDVVVVEEDAPPEEVAAEAQPEAGRALTPQELRNEGVHHYQISGITTPMLGNDGTVQDSGTCISEFTAEGVHFQLQDFDAGFIPRIADNRYEGVTEAGTAITLTYTDTGLRYYSEQENGIFLNIELTLDD